MSDIFSSDSLFSTSIVIFGSKTPLIAVDKEIYMVCICAAIVYIATSTVPTTEPNIN